MILLVAISDMAAKHFPCLEQKSVNMNWLVVGSGLTNIFKGGIFWIFSQNPSRFTNFYSLNPPEFDSGQEESRLVDNFERDCNLFKKF